MHSNIYVYSVPRGKKSASKTYTRFYGPLICTDRYKNNTKEDFMAQRLTGKVAVVNGASKGIGAAFKKHLCAEGASVVVNYSSSKEGADRVVNEITGKGGKAIAVQANVAKQKDIERLFAETKKAYGKLDILVNNAGVYEF